ncbi:sorbosone dehydrogenase family protein [Dyadobacter sp. CY323]|uniref:PQQ-dependent sugar dehydrogenase n=1 Tax=Dyadobacter sp. CY323 TaxID=2907302 RepID=UPI001F1BF8A2|nr:PQQ-dependent sugar dehydrogenase [Dyadobacter sp. CY323]MCE6991418.1 PQQ-dependent sugar dehydrogenase [Dyadobacter sp. CY323]
MFKITFRSPRPGLAVKLLIAASIPFFISCYGIKSSKGGGQLGRHMTRNPQAADVLLAPGYKIDLVTKGLTYPTACTFDDKGELYVIEGGYSYGESWTRPALIRISQNGDQKVIASGSDNGPWTGVDFYEGHFYIAEGGSKAGGKILKIAPSGKIDTLIANLPSGGDHHTNGPVVRNGFIYFSLGAATNSGVVGPDNAHYGWLKRKPTFHDIPCQDIILAGVNFDSEHALDKSAGSVTTGAYSPYGKPSAPNQRISGSIPCTGAVMRISVGGTKPEVVAWGYRNPFGLRFSPDGNLFVTENAYDERGSRPIWGAGDILWQVKPGTWYGFPDFSGDMLLAGDIEFKAPGSPMVQSVLKEHPNKPPKPAAILEVHSSSSGFDFANAAFGFAGEAFIAQFGDMAPDVGKTLAPVGFKLVRVDPASGVIRDFAINKGKRNGPASALGNGGLERPVSVKFNEAGDELYVVDFGIVQMSKKGPHPQEKTGVIWKITKTQP